MNRQLWLIWRSASEENRRRFKIGTLSYDGEQYRFKYDGDVDEAVKAGLDFFGSFQDLREEYIADQLFPSIASRLPNKERSDYLDILNSYNLSTDVDDFDILKATKGRLITDNFEFVPPFDRHKIEFNVAGIRHREENLARCKEHLKVHDKIILKPDEENPKDPHAVKVLFPHDGEEHFLGYVPRYYSKELFDLVKDENQAYSAMVSNLNLDEDNYDNKVSIGVSLVMP